MEFAAMQADEYFPNFISLSAHIQSTEFYQLVAIFIISNSIRLQLQAGRYKSAQQQALDDIIPIFSEKEYT